jgi:hypothetical protein
MNLRIACKIIKRDYLDESATYPFRWGRHVKASERYYKWWKRHRGKGRETKDKLHAVRDADGVLRERRPAPVSLAQSSDCICSDDDLVFLVSQLGPKTGENP